MPRLLIGLMVALLVVGGFGAWLYFSAGSVDVNTTDRHKQARVSRNESLSHGSGAEEVTSPANNLAGARGNGVGATPFVDGADSGKVPPSKSTKIEPDGSEIAKGTDGGVAEKAKPISTGAAANNVSPEGEVPSTANSDNVDPSLVVKSTLLETGRMIPDLGAFGGGDRIISEQRHSVTHRVSGLMPNQPRIKDLPKRLVRGRVVVKDDNGVWKGLAGVTVTDYMEIHRTFSSSDGSFEIEARFADGNGEDFKGTERDSTDFNDYVYLTAFADGYVLANKGVQVNGVPGQFYYQGITFGPEAVNAEAGIQLEMKWTGAEALVVKFKNPPTDPTKVNITVESYSNSSVNSDAGFFLSVPADKEGKAVFHVPNRQQLEIRAIGEEWRSKDPANYDNTQKAWLIELVPSANLRVSGNTVDLRTGKSLPGVRILVNSEKEVAYSDASGNFSILYHRDASFVHLICQHPSYAQVNSHLNEQAVAPFVLQPGGSVPSGPWTITMRPTVTFNAMIQAADGVSFSRLLSVAVDTEGSAGRVVHGTIERGQVKLSIGDFPWGAQKLTLITSDENNQQLPQYFVDLPASTWNDLNEYDLRLYANQRK